MRLITNSKYDVTYISRKLVKEFCEVSQIVGMPFSAFCSVNHTIEYIDGLYLFGIASRGGRRGRHSCNIFQPPIICDFCPLPWLQS